MFDDHTPQGSGAAMPPSNLPIADADPLVEPAFAGSAPIPAPAPTALEAGILTPKGPVAPAPPEPMDPFAALDTPSHPNPDMMAPAASSSMGSAASPILPTDTMPLSSMGNQPIGSGSAQPMASYDVKGPSMSRGIMTVIIVFVVLLIVGGGGWWIYSAVIKNPTSPNAFPSNQNTAPETGENGGSFDEFAPLPNTGAQEGAVTEPVDLGGSPTGDQAAEVDDRVLFGEPIDSDGDGLDDVREAGLKTDPNNWDSDSDLLSDGDEVIIWKTDPLNNDSDGDGYMDGQEVKGGYNPAGPGRYFDVPRNDAETVSASGDAETSAHAATNEQLRATVGYIGACTEAEYGVAATQVFAQLEVQVSEGTYTITEGTYIDAGVAGQIRSLLIADGCLLE